VIEDDRGLLLHHSRPPIAPRTIPVRKTT
jgi:hypothetical protein